MIQIIKEINVEVTKPNIFQALVAKQYDMNTRFLKVTLMDCGTRIDVPNIETAKVVINAERKDGQSKGFYGVINDDGTVTVPLHSWMLELEGTVICDISVLDIVADDNKKLTTTSFTLIVEKAAYGGNDITSDPQYDVLVSLLEAAPTAQEVAPAIQNTISGGEKTLTVNDVSPLEHKCSCRLTSDSGESRNIYKFDSENMKISFNENTLSKTYNENGTITLNGYTNAGISVEFYFRNLTVGETYTFSLKPYGVMFIEAYNQNHEKIGEPTIAENDVVTFTYTEDIDYYFAVSNAFGANEDDPLVNLTFYPQLELGTVATEWTQYGGNSYIEDFSTVKVNVNGKTYTPKADGTVTDIASVSPTMEITTDNEHINICDFTYCVDTKKYVDNNSGGGVSKEYVDGIVTEAGQSINYIVENYATKQYVEDYINEALGGEY